MKNVSHISSLFFRRILLMLMVLFGLKEVSMAQQSWTYSQYLFNLYDINAAYAGNHQTASFALRHRSQWIGLDGAPVTQQLSVHTPILGSKAGAGLRIMNEKIGARVQQNFKVSGAYKLHFDNKTLSFGISAGVLRQSIDKSKLTAIDNQDQQLMNLASSSITPIVDASVFFNTNKWYAGIESNGINRSSFGYSDGSLARLYYSMSVVAGVMKQIGDDNMFQLSTLTKISEGKVWQSELNALYLLHNKCWFGAGYRYQYGFQMMACVNISEHFRLGLSYDIASKSVLSSHDGSAEIFLGYTMNSKTGKSIRYF